MMPTIERARQFAIAAHGEQKYGEHPYSFHLDAVAKIAELYGEEAAVVAYLHDTVEDTSATLAEIEIRFGARVAACIALLTDEPGANRKERKAKTYAKLALVTGPSELALVVKVADRLANVRACIADQKPKLWEIYRGEHATFKQAAYRPGLCDPLWVELDELLTTFSGKKSSDGPADQ
jgi:(p)ppGpp synthase/HD superfamily hydrolase